MLAQSHARKPAPPLAARGMWLRLHVGADAFGSALGDAVVGAIQRGDQQNASRPNKQADAQATVLTKPVISGPPRAESTEDGWTKWTYPDGTEMLQDRPLATASADNGSSGGRQSALYRPGIDDAETIPVFAINGRGGVHEAITQEAAKEAGVKYSKDLKNGVQWPDVPTDVPGETNYPGLRNMDKPGNITYESHNGAKQFWHSMTPAGGSYTNGDVLDKIIDQTTTWYKDAQDSGSIMPVGKVLHTIQDSYSASHVERNDSGEIVRFQAYNEQDHGAHSHADEVRPGMDLDQWREIPGAKQALDASTQILKMYRAGESPAAVGKYLREDVYKFAPNAAASKAGGSAAPYKKTGTKI